ncbi:hypothetical protein DQ04_19541010 [Trypanosoma grayi]|uniref:hypothetical protein n=1 Tax=Trypanosoma grayi TaxID=71804 RepID=UPI0004F49F01|nr:hypothetical protein DQ04_19541010 [Trypanosoma grayi]KEG05663.1 hypothetical protein DQ04_19541010 [Trypanosoma grayi]
MSGTLSRPSEWAKGATSMAFTSKTSLFAAKYTERRYAMKAFCASYFSPCTTSATNISFDSCSMPGRMAISRSGMCLWAR